MTRTSPLARALALGLLPAALSAVAVLGPGCGGRDAGSGEGVESTGSDAVAEPRGRVDGPGEGERRARVEETDDTDALRALGYVDVAAALSDDDAVRVLSHDPRRAQPGLTLVTDAHNCRADLIDMTGHAVRSWGAGGPCFRWGNAVLLPDGDLLVVGRVPHRSDPDEAHDARYILRLSWDGQVRWRVDFPAHHDVELTPDGRIATLGYELRLLPEVHPTIPTRDHSIAVFDADGELLEEVSLLGLLTSNPDEFRLQPVEARTFDGKNEVDIFHSNAVEWMRSPELAAQDPLYSLGNVLLCIRHQDAVVILDWERKELVWAWGQGEISGPHDATVLANGNILLFDNGLGRGWSRVVELDPRTREIVWEFSVEEGQPFYTQTRGANQRLANGNTLITESDDALVFEITPDGDVVWSYRNPHVSKKREPGVLVRARRFADVDAQAMERLVAERRVPWVD